MTTRVVAMRFSLSGRADFGLSPLTLRRLPSASAPHLSWSCQVSAVFAAVSLPSAHLLNRLALRPVAEFPQPPWMVVTPSTTLASADFCPPERDRSPRIRCDCFPLTLAAFTLSCFDPFLDFTVLCQLIPHSTPLYAVFVHPVQVLLSGFLSTLAHARAVAFG